MNRISLAWELTRGRTRWLRPLYAIHNLRLKGGIRWAYVLARKLDGARRAKLGRWQETNGTINCETAQIAFSGACPVQGDGMVDGYPCYYRSRGEGWEFCVAATQDGDPLDDDAFVYHENPYIFPDGGWVHADVSRDCIRRGIEAYRNAT